MSTKVIMPQLGESVVEGTVSQWLKQIGEQVQEFEPLVEISTDKVTSEIPSPASGILLEIYVQEGATVLAGTHLCLIGQTEEQPAKVNLPKSGGNGKVSHPAAASAMSPASSIAREQRGQRLSPVVARMAAEHQLDLTRITGTGLGGRITKQDVEAFLAQTPSLQPWEQPGSGDLFKPTDAESKLDAPPPTAPARAIPIETIPQGATGELVPLTSIRRSIAEHMVRSKLQVAPHVTTVMEADMSSVLAHLEVHKPSYAKQGVNLTLTAYFVQAMVAACRSVPLLNSQWRDDGVFVHHNVHVGMAVALDEGLIVPIIKHAEGLNLLGTARQINDLATRARNKQLRPDEVQGGTITISNHGVSGSLLATPIINQPQSAILGVGLMEKRVKVIDDAIAIRPCCYLSLTFDHRVADGAAADGWLYEVKKVLENWAVES